MLTRFSIFLLALTAAAVAHAETVVLKDGTTREGVITSKTDQTITMKVNQDGITGTVVLNISDIDHLENSKSAPVAITPAPTPSGPATARTPAKPLPPPADLKTPGFLVDLGQSAIGRGLDDPSRLPKPYLSLWNAAMDAEKNGDLPAELDALRSLDSAFAAAPHGTDRLNAITQRVKQEPFGQWLAQVHVDELMATIKAPVFDLQDIRDAEKTPLIGMLKERTGPALEPLKTYFPPVDDKTGKMADFKPAQLQGISVSNALDVKHQAMLASAILLAQMKLEPDMPVQDRQLLGSQLQIVHHILSRANELEPAARAAAAQADREKKLSDLHAQQEAAKKNPLSTSTAPH